MLLRVERGKGRKDRHAMLSPQLLELRWWREGRRRSLLLVAAAQAPRSTRHERWAAANSRARSRSTVLISARASGRRIERPIAASNAPTIADAGSW
jgi:hypothetical protein